MPGLACLMPTNSWFLTEQELPMETWDIFKSEDYPKQDDMENGTDSKLQLRSMFQHQVSVSTSCEK